MRPSPADLISAGGVVIPERFQFLIWTIITCVGYMALVLLQDAATINGFPPIPDGLLLLTGLSAGTYAGSKMLRAPGPVAAQDPPQVTPGAGSIEFVVKGTNLPKVPSLRIDGIEVPALTPIACTGQANNPELCSQLQFTVADSAALSNGDHTLQISNAEGQFAEYRFTRKKPTILSITPASVAAGSTPVTLKIAGEFFRSDSRVDWLPPGATSAPSLVPAKPTDNSMEVDIVPGSTAGSGVLTIISPAGPKVAATIQVVK